MRQTILATLVVLATGTVATAQCPTMLMWGGPTRCMAKPVIGGGAQVLGSTADLTFSQYWQTNIDRRGNMYGYDAHGNYWRYDRTTGSYTYFNIYPDQTHGW